MRQRQRRDGITRVEVVAVSVLILLGVGLLLTFMFRNQGRSANFTCAENMRRIGVAIYERQGLRLKAEAGEGFFEGKDVWLPAARITDGYATWAVQMAPFLRSDTPLARWDMELPFTKQKAEVRDAVVPLFLCPARTRSSLLFSQDEKDGRMSGAVGDYACASGDGDAKHDWTGPNGNGAIIEGEVVEWEKGARIAKWKSRTSTGELSAKRGRGLAYTILVGEKHVPLKELGTLEGGDGSLYDGRHPACYARIGGVGYGLASGPEAPFNYNFGSCHPGHVNFLYADVSVRPSGVDISEEVLGGLIRRGP